MERIFREFDSIKQQKLQRKVQYHSFSLKRTQVDAGIAAETGLKERRALLKSVELTSSHSPSKSHISFLGTSSGLYQVNTEKRRDVDLRWWWLFYGKQKNAEIPLQSFLGYSYRHKANWVFYSNVNSSEHCSPAVSAWINEVSPPGNSH